MTELAKLKRVAVIQFDRGGGGHKKGEPRNCLSFSLLPQAFSGLLSALVGVAAERLLDSPEPT